MLIDKPEVKGFDSAFAAWEPQSDVDREAVREHLKRVLATPAFTASKRYPNFLCHVVERALEGRTDTLKERSLGIEVFHRDPTYDTSLDPVVRTTASEVRRRLGHYYSEAGSEHDLRIELSQGSYIPDFRRRIATNGAAASVSPPAGLALQVIPERAILSSSFVHGLLAFGRRTRLNAAFVLAIGVVLGALGTVSRQRMGEGQTQTAAVDEFWRPIMNSPKPVLVCLGELHASDMHPDLKADRNGFVSSAAFPHHLPPRDGYEVVSIPASLTLANVVTLLELKKKPFAVQGSIETNYSDLGKGPSVLLGAFSNDWTVRMTHPLRYYFDVDADSREVVIRDRQPPGVTFRRKLIGSQSVDNSESFALVSRFLDPTTGQMIVALAGLDSDGTHAAADFVRSNAYLEQFAEQHPVEFHRQNLQIVIAIDVVDQVAGPPRVVASYAW